MLQPCMHHALYIYLGSVEASVLQASCRRPPTARAADTNSARTTSGHMPSSNRFFNGCTLRGTCAVSRLVVQSGSKWSTVVNRLPGPQEGVRVAGKHAPGGSRVGRAPYRSSRSNSATDCVPRAHARLRRPGLRTRARQAAAPRRTAVARADRAHRPLAHTSQKHAKVKDDERHCA